MTDSTICTWPSCGHTAKGECRGGPRRIQLFTEDQLDAAVAAAFRRGQEAMRERAADATDKYLMVRTGIEVEHVCNVKDAIRAIPIEAAKK